jgi:hypothetical protein
MAELKTTPTGVDVEEFLTAVPDPTRQAEAREVCALITEVTGQAPEMWGPSIVGFGRYTYAYASGRSGEWMAVGFAPRKTNITVYLVDGFEEYPELLAALGPHTIGKSCLHIRRLSKVDTAVLRELVKRSYAQVTGSAG